MKTTPASTHFGIDFSRPRPPTLSHLPVENNGIICESLPWTRPNQRSGAAALPITRLSSQQFITQIVVQWARLPRVKKGRSSLQSSLPHPMEPATPPAAGSPRTPPLAPRLTPHQPPIVSLGALHLPPPIIPVADGALVHLELGEVLANAQAQQAQDLDMPAPALPAHVADELAAVPHQPTNNIDEVNALPNPVPAQLLNPHHPFHDNVPPLDPTVNLFATLLPPPTPAPASDRALLLAQQLAAAELASLRAKESSSGDNRDSNEDN